MVILEMLTTFIACTNTSSYRCKAGPTVSPQQNSPDRARFSKILNISCRPMARFSNILGGGYDAQVLKTLLLIHFV